MKILNKYYSSIFKLADKKPNTSRAMLNKIPKEFAVSLKEIQTGKFSSDNAKSIVGLVKSNKNLSLNDYIDNTLIYLFEKIGLSPMTAPAFRIFEELEKVDAAYIPAKNMILVSENSIKKCNDALKSALLVHEATHLRQVYDALRTEGLANYAVQKLAKESLDGDRQLVLKTAENFSNEQLLGFKTSGEMTPQQYDIYVMAKKVNAKGIPIEDFKKKHSQLYYQGVKRVWKNLQNKLIEEKGTIKKNTDKAQQVEKLFNSILKPFDAGTKEYLESKHEQEAYFIGQYFHDLYLAVKSNSIKNFF